MALQSPAQNDVRFPGEEDQQKHSEKRKRRGSIWATAFMVSTMVGIIALTALLYNIVNSAFGYVVVQNAIDPEALVLDVQKERMLGMPNLMASEDDQALADQVAADPYAIGFLGYAYYQGRAEELRVLPVEGVEADVEAVDSGQYPLARPLYIYSAADALQEKPDVAAYVDYYLENVAEVISEVGYFPASESAVSNARSNLADALEEADWDSAPVGEIVIVGSSTVFPLTQRIADGFIADGYAGDIRLESVGTSAGIVQLCTDSAVDIANASRAISRQELELCDEENRTPLEFRVGTDAIAVVVSAENDFVTDLGFEQLRLIFAEAKLWSDVNPEWPDEPIQRYVPSVDSGTLDFFVETAFDLELRDLPKETLQALLEANVSAGLMRRFEHDQPFAERSQESVYRLVEERVVQPEIMQSWTLVESIFNRAEIEEVAASIPNGEIVFRSWVTADFLTSPQSSRPDDAGIRTAILGSLWVVLITIVFSLPLGVGAAIYLEEYAAGNWLNNLIETNINNLAGVPSIIYGMLGLAIFVRALEVLTSGTLFGAMDLTTANGRTVISAGLTLGLLILPIIIINAREAVRAVPSSLRQASYGLGATRWQTIWNHVLPNALPGILTGTILAISRAIGETAPLVVIGASTFIVVDPTGPFSKFTTLPIQIYQWTSRPQDEFRNLAAAAIIVLLILLLTLNASAVILRNRYSAQRI